MLQNWLQKLILESSFICKSKIYTKLMIRNNKCIHSVWTFSISNFNVTTTKTTTSLYVHNCVSTSQVSASVFYASFLCPSFYCYQLPTTTRRTRQQRIKRLYKLFRAEKSLSYFFSSLAKYINRVEIFAIQIDLDEKNLAFSFINVSS